MKRPLSDISPAIFLICVITIGGLAPYAHAKPQKPGPFKVSAIQIQEIQSDEVKLPAEFQTSLYENVIEQVEKTKRFQHVYRDGEMSAAGVPDLVTLRCTVKGFKQGSAMARQVTTVAGKTTVEVHVQFTDRDGKSLLETDTKGQVRFFGENLRATYDFGKKVGGVVRENFLATSPASK